MQPSATEQLVLTLSSSLPPPPPSLSFSSLRRGPPSLARPALPQNAHPSMSHVSPAFAPVFGNCLRMLRQLLYTDQGQPFVIAGSGTLGWDLVAANRASSLSLLSSRGSLIGLLERLTLARTRSFARTRPQ